MCRLRAGQQWPALISSGLYMWTCEMDMRDGGRVQCQLASLSPISQHISRNVLRQCQLAVCVQKQGLKWNVKRLKAGAFFFTKNRPPSLLICAPIDLPFSKSIKVCKIDFLLDFWSGLMKKQYVKSENRKEGVNLCAILYAPFDSYAPFLIFWFTYCFFSLTSFKIYRKLIKNTRHRTQNAMRVRHDSGRRIFA